MGLGWVKSASASIWGAIGLAPAPSEEALRERTAEIRYTMLSTLGDQGARAYPATRRRIMLAENVEALWYARSDWMQAIAAVHGESVAAAHLRSVNFIFQGLGQKGLSSRPSPLA